ARCASLGSTRPNARGFAATARSPTLLPEARRCCPKLDAAARRHGAGCTEPVLRYANHPRPYKKVEIRHNKDRPPAPNRAQLHVIPQARRSAHADDYRRSLSSQLVISAPNGGALGNSATR